MNLHGEILGIIGLIETTLGLTLKGQKRADLQQKVEARVTQAYLDGYRDGCSSERKVFLSRFENVRSVSESAGTGWLADSV